MRVRSGYHAVVVHRSGSFFAGVALLWVAACASTSDGIANGQPPPTECTQVSDCPEGTAACIDSFCVAQGCADSDNDGAGVGPGCSVFDCDDADPAVPGAETCNEKDDDCNGLMDEGCPCLDSGGNPLPDGSTQPCGGTGECAGTQHCVSGTWSSTCEGGKEPSPSEICGNASDENCNGQKDEGCCPSGESPCPGLAVCSSNGVCN